MKYALLDAIRSDLAAGSTTVSKITAYYLEQIRLNASLNAFNEVFAEEALERATQIDAKLASGLAGKLAGMVIGIKDNICFSNT